MKRFKNLKLLLALTLALLNPISQLAALANPDSDVLEEIALYEPEEAYIEVEAIQDLLDLPEYCRNPTTDWDHGDVTFEQWYTTCAEHLPLGSWTWDELITFATAYFDVLENGYVAQLFSAMSVLGEPWYGPLWIEFVYEFFYGDPVYGSDREDLLGRATGGWDNMRYGTPLYPLVIGDISFDEAMAMMGPNQALWAELVTDKLAALDDFINQLPGAEITVDCDRNVTVDGAEDYDVENDGPNTEGDIVITLPEGTFPDNVVVTLPGSDWEYVITEDPGTGEVIVTITPGEICGDEEEEQIVIDVDCDRNVTVDGADEYDVENDGPNTEGEITITFPEGTNPDDIVVNLPGTDWDYDITENPEGEVVVIVTPGDLCDEDDDDSGNNGGPGGGPGGDGNGGDDSGAGSGPSIEIEVDCEEVTVNGEDREFTVDGDGNIVIVLPEGTNPGDIVVTVPDDWASDESSIVLGDDGTVRVVVNPDDTCELDTTSTPDNEKPRLPQTGVAVVTVLGGAGLMAAGLGFRKLTLKSDEK